MSKLKVLSKEKVDGPNAASINQQASPQSTVHYTYRVPQVYVPSSELGLSHPPLSPASVPLPPEPKVGGGGAHSPAGEGLGESQFRRLEKKSLALCGPFCKLFLHREFRKTLIKSFFSEHILRVF
jgi:hypothetical protein